MYNLNVRISIEPFVRNYSARLLKASLSQHQLNQARAIYKYNVSKKISQLNKVIQLFLSQIADRQYQIQKIKFYNESRISSVFENHFNTIASLSHEFYEFKDKTETDYSADYQAEFKKLNDDYHNLALLIDSSIQNLISEALNLNNEVNEIDVNAISKNQELQETFLKCHSKTFSFLQSKIKKMDQDLRKEIETLEITSNNKLAELQRKSNDTIDNLTKEYKQELSQLNSQKIIQIGLDETFLTSFQSFTSSFSQISNEFHLLRNNFPNSSTKSKINDLISEYQNNFDLFNKEERNLENELIQLIAEMSKEKDDLDDLYKESQVSKEKELIEKQKYLVNLIEQNNNEYLDKINAAKLSSKVSNSSIKELFDSLEKERNDLIVKFETVDKIQAKNDLNHIIQSIKIEDDQFALKIKEFQEMLQIHKEKHFVEKATVLSTHQEDLDNEMEHFKTESQKIRQLIQTNTNSSNSMFNDQSQISYQIKSEKCRIIQKHTKLIDEFDMKKQNEINQIKSAYSLEIEKIIQEENDILENVLQESKSIISSTENEFNQKKNEIVQYNKNKRFNLLNEILNESQQIYNDAVTRIEQNYKELYDQESQKLAQIEPPSNSFNFSSLNNQLNDLAMEKADKLRRISIGRTEINEKYEYEIQNEKLRHENYLNEMKNKGRKLNGRDTLRQSLRFKIADVQKSRESEGDELKGLLQQLQEIYQISIDKFQTNIFDEKNQTEKEINELTELLNKLIQESNDQIQQKNEICKSEVEIFTNELLETNKSLDSQKSDVEQSHQNMVNKFNNLFTSLNFQLFEITRNSTYNCNRYKEDYLNMLQTIEKNHRNQLEQLNDQITQKKSMNTKQMIENNDNLQSMTKLHVEKIDSYKKEIEEMKKELMKKKNAMMEFLEEKFNIAINLNEEWKCKYSNRPSRESEIDIIDKLENHCKILTGILKSALKDITQYRKLNAAKEKEYNAKFGRNPSIGVMYTGVSTRKNNRFAY